MPVFVVLLLNSATVMKNQQKSYLVWHVRLMKSWSFTLEAKTPPQMWMLCLQSLRYSVNLI